MIPRKAFELAVSGGWRPFKREVEFAGSNMGVMEEGGPATMQGWSVWNFVHEPQKGSSVSLSHYETALSPTFWQALKLKEDCSCGENHWIDEAVEFTKLILTGGDTEQFWKDLLT